MENKRNIRKALKAIENLSAQMEEGMAMDHAMDGSGECGGHILRSWCNWFDTKLQDVLTENCVTTEELLRVTAEWAQQELDLGPKQIWVSMYSRRQGMYKEVDYFDTRWGSINFELHQLTHA